MGLFKTLCWALIFLTRLSVIKWNTVCVGSDEHFVKFLKLDLSVATF